MKKNVVISLNNNLAPVINTTVEKLFTEPPKSSGIVKTNVTVAE